MSTRETIRQYLNAVSKRSGWETFLADDARFASLTSPGREVAGKAGFLEATKRFYSKIASIEVRDLIVDGDSAVALTRYEVNGGSSGTFTSDVAEVFQLKDGKIAALSIYFDTAPYPK